MHHDGDVIVIMRLNYGLTTEKFLIGIGSAREFIKKFNEKWERITITHFETNKLTDINHCFGEVSKIVDATKLMSASIVEYYKPMYYYPVSERGVHCDIICTEDSFTYSSYNE